MKLSDGLLDVTRQITSVMPIGIECGTVLLVVESDEGLAVVQSLAGELLMDDTEKKRVVVNLLIDIVNRLTQIESV